MKAVNKKIKLKYLKKAKKWSPHSVSEPLNRKWRQQGACCHYLKIKSHRDLDTGVGANKAASESVTTQSQVSCDSVLSKSQVHSA